MPPVTTAKPQPEQQANAPNTQPPSGNGNSPTGFNITRGRVAAAQRIVFYGMGGIGKSTLAAHAPEPLLVDLERGTYHMDITRVDNITDWKLLRNALHTRALIDNFQTIIIDTATAAERLAIDHTIATVTHEKGHRVTSVEGYGFGKGYQHVYETFLTLLQDLDQIVSGGRNAVLVCHEIVDLAPNPEGDDYRRYEPNMQQPPKNGRIRDTVKNWCDHLVYIGEDKVTRDGKARGTGTRTCYFQPRPTFWAKSRAGLQPMEFQFDPANGLNTAPEIWAALLGTKASA